MLVTSRAFLSSALIAVGLLAANVPGIASADGDRDAHVARVLELTNVERQKVGAPPLLVSAELNVAAQSYSDVLARTGCFEHTCGPVPDMAARIGQSGYRGWTALAENIAWGYPSPEAVIAGWMGSAGHRQNMLNPRYREIGVGLAVTGNQNGTYWTQDFGARTETPRIDLASAPSPEAPAADEPAGD
jgi:uncharacterized protein YkwD